MANETIGFSIKVDGVERSVQSISELQKTIADLKKEAKTLDIGSKAFEETTERIRLAQAKFREFKNDTKAKEIKDQFNDLAGGVSSSFNVAQSSLKAFGVESKAMGTAASSANAMISAALQFRNIQEMKVEASAARRMVVEKAAAAGTVILNTVNKALNTTLKANPIGVLITAIGLLVVGVTALINPIKKLISNFDFLNTAAKAVWDTLRNVASFLTGGLIDDAATAKTKDNAQKVIDAFDNVLSAQNKTKRANEQQLAMLESQGASEKEIHDQKIKNMQMEVAALIILNKAYAQRGDLTDEERKKVAENTVAIETLMNQMKVEDAKYNKSVSDAAAKASEERKKTAEEKQKEADAEKKRKADELKALNEKVDAQVVADEREVALAKEKDEIKRMILEESYRHADALREIDAAAQAGADEADIQRLRDLELQKQEIAVQAQKDKQAELDAQAAEDKKKKDDEAAAAAEQAASDLQAFKDAQTEMKGYMIGLKEDGVAKELELLDFQQEQEQGKLDEALKNKLITQQEYDQASVDLKKATSEEKTKIIMTEVGAELDMTAQALGAVSGLLKKGSKTFKAVKTAETIISGLAALVKTWEGYADMGIIGTILAAVQTAGIIATTASTVAQINKTEPAPTADISTTPTQKPQPSKFAKGGIVKGSGSPIGDSITAMLSPGESVINAKSTEAFGGLLSNINQAGGGAPIGDATAQGTPIVKAYVVSSEMTSQQEADKKVRDLARV